jgi:hypothetical protein
VRGKRKKYADPKVIPDPTDENIVLLPNLFVICQSPECAFFLMPNHNLMHNGIAWKEL